MSDEWEHYQLVIYMLFYCKKQNKLMLKNFFLDEIYLNMWRVLKECLFNNILLMIKY